MMNREIEDFYEGLSELCALHDKLDKQIKSIANREKNIQFEINKLYLHIQQDGLDAVQIAQDVAKLRNLLRQRRECHDITYSAISREVVPGVGGMVKVYDRLKNNRKARAYKGRALEMHIVNRKAA